MLYLELFSNKCFYIFIIRYFQNKFGLDIDNDSRDITQI